jgi:hypothetical protein
MSTTEPPSMGGNRKNGSSRIRRRPRIFRVYPMPAVLLLLLALLTSVGAQIGLSTLAGTKGTCGSTGDGGDPTAALLKVPYAVAVDIFQNVYIADQANHKVRLVTVPIAVGARRGRQMLTASYVINTLAGTGTAGSTGDGADASSALLNTPSGLQVTTSGLVYVADTGNHKIRLIDQSKNNQITTLVGTGTAGSADGAAAVARLNAPTAVTFDTSGNVYIADTGNNKIRMVSATGIVSTLAGGGTGSDTGVGA